MPTFQPKSGSKKLAHLPGSMKIFFLYFIEDNKGIYEEIPVIPFLDTVWRVVIRVPPYDLVNSANLLRP